jgi:hypothetical protein
LDAVLELGIVWKYPAILTDEVIGEQATSVLRMHKMLNVILKRRN